MINLKLLIFFIWIHIFNISFSQDSIEMNCESKIYLVGDLHLDQASSMDSEDKSNLMANSLIVQKEIVEYLSDSCELKYILAEYPVVTEYFLNRYLESNNTTEFWFYYGRNYLKSKLNLYNEIQNKNPNVRIKCYDLNNDVEPALIISALFNITFYERYKNLLNIGQNYSAQNIKDEYQRIYDLYIVNSTNISDVQFIWDLYYIYQYKYSDWRLKRILFKHLSEMTDESLLKLSTYYEEDYDFFYRLRKSYLSGFSIPKNNLEKREPLLFQGFIDCISGNSEDVYYVDGGFAHMLSVDGFDNFRSMVDKTNLKVTSFYLYYNWFSYFYPAEWENIYEADFTGSKKFYPHKIGNSMDYIISLTTQ